MRNLILIGTVLSLLVTAGGVSAGPPPAQRLPSALLIYPFVSVEGNGQARDTRIEITNLTRSPKSLKCVYVSGTSCSETNFFINLTANQPISWLASTGTYNIVSRSAVPPFRGTGQLQCVVLPEQPGIEYHNAVQGRAIVFEPAAQSGQVGETIGYGAIGFRRLSPGEFTGTINLDGTTYEQCPDELHFAFLGTESNSQSEAVFVPCSQEVLFREPSTVVQVRVVNELEQMLSASFTVTCQSWIGLEEIGNLFRRTTLGSETGHVIFRGVTSPVLGLLIDRFTPDPTTSTPFPAPSTSANEPILRGGRSATVKIP